MSNNLLDISGKIDHSMVEVFEAVATVNAAKGIRYFVVGAPYIRMLDRAQDFTARIDFNDYERALAQLRAANAFLEPHEGQLRMPEQAIAT